MKRVKKIELIQFTAVGLLGIMLLGCSVLFCQEIDPFYTKLLQDGEKLFLARKYREAAKTLEVAAFGLHQEKKLKAKAYVYMSLSFYYLKDYEKCEEFLRKTEELIEEEGFENLDLMIDDYMRSDLERLTDQFHLRIKKGIRAPATILKEPAEERPEIKTSEEKIDAKARRPEKERPKDPVKELEQRIKQEPRNVSLYYELYDLHRKNNDYKATKKVIESLVKKNPREVQGFYLLGLMNYQQRKYKDAAKNFDHIIGLSGKVQIGEYLLLQTKAYLLFCFHYQRKEGKIQELLARSIDVFSEEKIRSLALGENEESLLLKIIKTHKGQAAARKVEMRIKELERAMKRAPQNTSLYYEFYVLYMTQKNEGAAKKVLKDLIKKNPDEYRGIYLLAKIEFSQKKYKDAIKSFNKVLRLFESIPAGNENELVLKSSIYISLCLYHLNQKDYFESYVTGIEESIPEERLKQILKEEGLEEEWNRIIRNKEG